MMKSTSAWKFFAAALLLAVMTGTAYLPALEGGFIWDDDKYVTENPLIVAPDGLWRIWFSLDSPSQYFPMVYTSFRIEHALFGFDPLGYHLTNLVLHALNALLIGLLLRRMGIPGAWLASALFALHPVHVESVAWITERKNVLMAFFSLLSLLAWVRFSERQQDSRRGGPFYILSLLFYLLALLSKSTACTLPAALVLIVWLKRLRLDARRWLQITPFVLFGLAMGLLSIWWEEHHQGTQAATLGLSAAERILIAGRALWFYACKLVWPVDMAFSYPMWKLDSSDPMQYGWLLACLVVAGGIWHWRARLGRGTIAAVLFFAATLSPMIGFFSLYTFNYTFVADHYQYMASVGLIALFAAAAARIFNRPGAVKEILAPVLCILLLTLLGVLTWHQSKVYRDRETLWSDTLEKNPGSWMAHNNLGLVLEDRGDLDSAMMHYRQAIRLRPDDIEPLGNLGNALLRQGKIDEAISCFNQALQVNPDHYFRYMTYTDLGSAYANKGMFDEAMDYYYKALRLKPDYHKAHYNLGYAFAEKEQFDRAVYHYQRALEIKSDYFLAHKYLSRSLIASGEIDEAVMHLQAALSIQPDRAEEHYSLGLLLVKQGKLNKAAVCFTKALRFDPALKERQIPPIPEIRTHYNLGIARAREERFEEAFVQFSKALEYEPDYAPAAKGLGNVLAGMNRFEEAGDAFRGALKYLPRDANLHYRLAVVLIHQKKNEDAVEDAVEHAVEDAIEEAIEHLGIALELDPGNAQALRQQKELQERRRK